MKLSLQKYWQLLSRHIQPQKGRFVLLSVLLFGSIGLQIINPQIMRGFIDDALGGGPINQLTVSAAAFIGIAILQQILSVTVTYLGENVAWTATNALRSELAWHCLNLDMGFHNQHTPGELIERIDGDVAELATFFSQFVVIIVGNVLLLAGILIALFRENWGAGLTFTVFAVVALLILTRIRDIAVVHQKNRRQAEADLFGFIEEQLSGTEDIRSSGAMSYSLRELFRLQGNILRHDKLAHFKGWIIHNSIGGMLVLGNMLAIACGYLLFRGGSITIGTVYLFIHYINLLEQPIWALTHQIEGFQTIGACIERLTELRQVQPKVVEEGLSTDDDTPLGEPLGAGALSLDFQKVTFAYEHDEPVLNDLDFHLAEGKTLGLLGRTGSGKTTLTRLVFRLYDPSAGSISLGRQDIRQVRLNTLRQKIAIVTQDVQLFRASVRENLTFFNPAISDAQIETAIEALELGEWYRSLPQGLDTQLESGGHSLSAGEAQLLAFTRVFLRSPGLVILDEASSRLDPATEQHIERAIDRLLQERTAIIIAHRLETVYRADEIMILENGSTVEHGLRHELASDPESKFFQLLQTGLEEVLV
jgi:ATP-binding cassette subfamily B protein